MGIFDPKPVRTKSDETKQQDEAPKTMDERIVEALRQVFDPEIPVNIYEMGLIYRHDFDPETGKVKVDMTLTSPHCPAAQELPADVKYSVENLPEVSEAEVEIVWDPPWGPELMSEEAKMELGMF